MQWPLSSYCHCARILQFSWTEFALPPHIFSTEMVCPGPAQAPLMFPSTQLINDHGPLPAHYCSPSSITGLPPEPQHHQATRAFGSKPPTIGTASKPNATD